MRTRTVLLLLVLAACDRGRQIDLPVLKQLSPVGIQVRQPGMAVSPDGKRAVWWEPATDSSGLWELWAGNVDQSSRIRLSARTAWLHAPLWSPDGKWISVGAHDNGTNHATIVATDGGGGPRTISTKVSWVTSWFPDGDRLIYQEEATIGNRVYLFRLSTGEVTRLWPDDRRAINAYASPDGRHIAWVATQGTEAQVYVTDADGHNSRRIGIDGRTVIPWQFSSPWSPDGSSFVMLSLRTGRADIWLAYVDSTKPPRQVTRDVRDDFSPRWSGDGRYIAFISNRGRQFDVWVTDVEDGTETRVTDSPITESETPQWISGTHSLLVISDSSTASLWIRDLSSGTERQLTPDSLRVSGYDIHPQGKQVAIAIDRGGGIHDLAVLSIEGGTLRTLITGGGSVVRPEWSPDGSAIAFASDRSGIGDIWSVDTAGTLRRRTNWAGLESAIGWARDGSYYFMSDSSAGFADVWTLPSDGGQPRQVTRDGSIVAASVRRSSDNVFVGTNSIAAGRSSLARVERDGSLAPLWDQSEAGPFSLSPSGDSLLLWVDDARGQSHSGIIGARGGPVTLIGKGATDWSPDGRMIACTVVANGSSNLATYTVADSSRRFLTNTPEQERSGRFTPDSKSIVFTRGINTVRVFRADLDQLLAR